MFYLITSDDGKLLQPNIRSVICSTHFVGGTSSRNPQSLSYVPTIFLDIYKRKTCNQEQIDTRFKRLIKRQKVTEIIHEPIQVSVENNTNNFYENSESKSTQV